MSRTPSGPGLRLVIAALEEQGCRIRETRSGVFVYCPDGTTTIGFHLSKSSDKRAMKNLRADVRRAGLAWPEKVPA